MGLLSILCQQQKKIEKFCKSIYQENISVVNGIFSISDPDGVIVGISSVEAVSSLTQPVCWVDNKMYPITFGALGQPTLSIVVNTPITGTGSIQYIVQQSIKILYNDAVSGGLLIGYTYIPPQCLPDIPSTLTVKSITKPETLYISTLGNGGSIYDREPFSNPLESIPLSDINILSDNEIYNVEPLRFPTFSITGGFVELPVLVPGNIGTIVLSSPGIDSQSRSYYSICSNEFIFRSEGISVGAPRKIFLVSIIQIIDSPDLRMIPGDYFMMIVSKSALVDTTTYTGYKTGDTCTVSLFRLPNRPLLRA